MPWGFRPATRQVDCPGGCSGGIVRVEEIDSLGDMVVRYKNCPSGCTAGKVTENYQERYYWYEVPKE